MFFSYILYVFLVFWIKIISPLWMERICMILRSYLQKFFSTLSVPFPLALSLFSIIQASNAYSHRITRGTFPQTGFPTNPITPSFLTTWIISYSYVLPQPSSSILPLFTFTHPTSFLGPSLLSHQNPPPQPPLPQGLHPNRVPSRLPNIYTYTHTLTNIYTYINTHSHIVPGRGKPEPVYLQVSVA